MINHPHHNIHIDYPKTERGEKLSAAFSFITYLSIIFVTFSSYIKFGDKYFDYVVMCEIIFSFLFLVDFLIRFYLSKFSRRFLINFYTILDIISILPFFIIGFMNSSNFIEILIIFRIGRLLRLFRVGKLHFFIKKLRRAIEKNQYRFKLGGLFFLIVLLLGSFIMYGLESQANPEFATIPNAMRWMATKLFMVGYTSGNPITHTGIFVGSILLFIGPVFISILTGTIIVTFIDMINLVKDEDEHYVCEHCLSICNKETDIYCKICGKKLP